MQKTTAEMALHTFPVFANWKNLEKEVAARIPALNLMLTAHLTLTPVINVTPSLTPALTLAPPTAAK